MMDLSRIYKILNDDAKVIVQDLQYSSKALRGTSFFLFFLAGGAFFIGAGLLAYLRSTSGALGAGYLLLLVGLIFAGVGAKFFLDYSRMTKRYRKLFALFTRI
jgi:hypothetical protein